MVLVTERRRGASARAVRVVAGSLLGWVGVAVGVALGARWLVSDGVSGAALLGLAVLGLGLAGLVVAVRELWSATSGWRRWAALAAWLVATLVALYVIGLGTAVVTPPPTPVPGAPAGLPGREVTMPTADGTVLAGWYVPGSNGAAVVVRHGSGSQRTDTAGQAAVLARAGYGVLLTDARGHGSSSGRAMDFGWWGESDIRAAVDFLAAQPDVDPARIAVLGLSMGGEEALGAAGQDPRIAAIVAEGATWRTASDRAWLSDEYGVAGQLQELLDAGVYGVAALLTQAPQPATLRAAVARSQAPTLLIAAGTVPDEQLVAAQLSSIDPERVRTWVVPDAGHIGGLARDPEGWRQAVVGFLDDALAVPGGG